MPTPAERSRGWIESLADAWKDRLKGWLVGFLSFGLEVFMDIMGKAFAPILTPLVEKLEEQDLPEWLKPLLGEIKNPQGEIAALLGQSAAAGATGGLISSTLGPFLLKGVQYPAQKLVRQFIPPDIQLISAVWRGLMPLEAAVEALKNLGYPDDWINILEQLLAPRLDPNTVITAWRRDPAKYEKLFQDLRDQGLDDDRIEAIKFVTLYYPSPQELIHWQAREVFEPEMVSKYGLKSGLGKLRRDDFYKAGMDDPQIDNHWIAHWEHANWMQVVEMLHRGIITEQDVKDWFPLVEMAPYWAENLIKIAYAWPTRVDVRRFWDMRTISEERLRELYKGMGYHGENLEDYIKWTKVYTDFPMMIARFKNGWITEDDIRSWLRGLGIPEDRVQQFIEEKTKPEAPARVEQEKQATATEIMKGVKKGYITWAEGVEMLGDLGYPPEIAEFKLKVYIGVSEGSPDTYSEFKDWSQSYRAAVGLDSVKPPPELIEAERALNAAQKELNAQMALEPKEAKLIPYRKAKDDAQYRYRQLLTQWNESKKT